MEKRGDDASMTKPPAGPTPAIVDARLTEVIARFGDRLSPEQRAQVRARIERSLTISAKLRQTPLTSADEPEIVFAPYRGDQ